MGANTLVGTDVQEIIKTAKKMIEKEEQIRKKLEKTRNPFGDGHASRKILEAVKKPDT